MTSPSPEAVMTVNDGAVVLHMYEAATSDTSHGDICPSLPPLNNTSSNNISLSIPVSLLKQREGEMRQTASRLAIPKERWCGSLVYLQWEKQTTSESDPDLTVGDGGSRMVSIDLFPEALSHKKTSFEWTRSTPSSLMWMQALLMQFYTTGTVSIPIAARGHDVVSLLDWLQIVYAPDQCHFADYAVYQRVRQWSRYLCHRSVMATNIVGVLEAAESNTCMAFATVDMETQSDQIGQMTLIDGVDTVVFALGEGNDDVSMVKHHSSLTKMAFKLFNAVAAIDGETLSEINDEVTLHGPEESTAAEMRLDFAAHVAQRLETIYPSAHTVTFPIRAVSTCANDFGKDVTRHRAVLIVSRSPIGAPPSRPLHCRPLPRSSGSTELNAPVDELVDEKAQLTTAPLFQKGESRTVSFKDTSMDDSLNTTAPNTPQSTGSCDMEQLESSAQVMASCSSYVNLADQIKATSDSTTSGQSRQPLSWRASSLPHDDGYNAPHDELNASFELNSSIEMKPSVDTGILSTRSSLETANLPKKKRKPKPVFELPEKLLSEESFSQKLAPPIPLSNPPFAENARLLNDNSLLPAPFTIVRTGTYDNTVTSALTGPFYIDDNGNLRDVFEHSADADVNENDDDDDTRAQARRHEWIQTALLNRGIGERMETLLKEEPEESTPTLTSIDPWEWLTGLGVCEFSRAFVQSVEEYAREIGVDLRRDPDQTTPIVPENVETKGDTIMTELNPFAPNAFANTKSDEIELVKAHPINVSMEKQDEISPSTIVQGHLHTIQSALHDVQEMEDSAHQGYCNIELVDQNDSLDESSMSQGSRDSPRGVQTFDTIMPETVKLSNSAILVCKVAASGDSTVGVTQEQVVTRRKNRGIKSLFRRRKIDV